MDYPGQYYMGRFQEAHRDSVMYGMAFELMRHGHPLLKQRAEPKAMQRYLEEALAVALKDLERPYRIGSHADLIRLGYDVLAEESNGRTLYATSVGIELREQALALGRLEWSLVLDGMCWC